MRTDARRLSLRMIGGPATALLIDLTPFHRPSNRPRDAVRTDETERGQAVESAVVETGRHFMAWDYFSRPRRSGWLGRNAAIFSGADSCLLGSGFGAIKLSQNGLRGV